MTRDKLVDTVNTLLCDISYIVIWFDNTESPDIKKINHWRHVTSVQHAIVHWVTFDLKLCDQNIISVFQYIKLNEGLWMIKRYFWSYIKQIMNIIHSYGRTDILIWWKMKCSIKLVFTVLNRTSYLSPHAFICTIALIVITIHYLCIRFIELSFFWC